MHRPGQPTPERREDAGGISRPGGPKLPPEERHARAGAAAQRGDEESVGEASDADQGALQRATAVAGAAVLASEVPELRAARARRA